MRVRFTVRSDDGDAGPFAVWDGSVNGWRSKNFSDEAAASRAAAELELQYDAHGPRNPDTVRRQDAPRQVQRVEWVPAGKLYAWVLTDREWYGLVCDDDDGRMTYVPGDQLRPETS
ncbi:hypothetical protein ACIA49_38865 [Kribbella sp. NPDC051587]|uniref:hypothetical protein n=1 Tax=Kribbella sp. NPDC051587 TaxID=3364119 RepID=UPI0037929844